MAASVRALILNSGSSTLKWAVLAAADGRVLASGTEPWSQGHVEQIRARLAGVPAFDAVGHRVVHGGLVFPHSVVVDSAVRKRLEVLEALDDLHLRPELAGIDAVGAAFPGMPQVVAFDTSFHASLPEAAAGYALPHEWSERWGLRRFGFHGLSVAWSVDRLRDLAGASPARVIVCHLGGGCSVTAVADGRSADTTMGFTPLEGLVMATRSGSVDPGLLLHLILQRGVAAADVLEALTDRSGLLGVSGVSADLRAVLGAADEGNARARLAYDRFILSLRRAIGAAAGVLGGAEALVFTGGIGENSSRVRSDAAAALAFAGLKLDVGRNSRAMEDDTEISATGAGVRAFVVHAREDVMVLREVARLLRWAAPGPQGIPSRAP